jgi:hypothetical protein
MAGGWRRLFVFAGAGIFTGSSRERSVKRGVVEELGERDDWLAALFCHEMGVELSQASAFCVFFELTIPGIVGALVEAAQEFTEVSGWKFCNRGFDFFESAHEIEFVAGVAAFQEGCIDFYG